MARIHQKRSQNLFLFFDKNGCRKLTCLLSFLSLALAALLCFAPQNAAADLEAENVRSFTGINGSLLLQKEEGYFLADESGVLTALKTLENASPMLLDGYGIDRASGAVYQPSIDTNNNLTWLEITAPNRELAELLQECQDLVMFNGILYISIPNLENMQADVYQYTIAGQSVDRLPLADVYAIAGYQDSQLLVAGRNRQTQGIRFSLWNPATAVQTLWGEMESAFLLDQVWGLTYHAPEDAACFVLHDRAYRWEKGKTPAVIGYLSNPSIQSGAITANGSYWLQVNENFRSFSSETLVQRRTLTISGQWLSSDINPAFEQLYPEIDVRILWDDTFSSDQILVDLTTRQAQADIFTLNVSSGLYSAMREKGFCADLSQSERLRTFTAALYPEIHKWTTWEDTITALPYKLHAESLMGINDSVLKKLGLSRPITFRDLISLYADWGEINAAYEDAYTLSSIEFAAGRSWIVRDFVNLYIASMPEGASLNFEAEAFVDMLTYLDEQSKMLPPFTLAQRIVYDSAEVEKNTLLNSGFPLLLSDSGSTEGNFTAMPLKIDEEHEAVIPASLSLLAINAASPNQDIAIKYLECLVENYPAEAGIMFLDEPALPVENESYAKNKLAYLQLKEDLLALLQKAKPEEEADLKAQLEEAEYILWEIETRRWYISQTDIEKYQAIAPFIRILPGNGFDFYSALPNMQLLVHEYINEKIPAIEFARRFNTVQKMINEEQR